MIVKKEVFNNATESKHEVEGLQIKLERRPNNIKMKRIVRIHSRICFIVI